MNDTVKSFQKAEKLIKEGKDLDAERILNRINHKQGLVDITSFRLGEIYNRLGEPEKSFNYHGMAFRNNRNLASKIVSNDHPNYHYVYNVAEEKFVDNCPLCGTVGYPYSAYNMIVSHGYTNGFNPIRLWMICNSCNHIFAHNFPKHLEEVLRDDSKNYYMNDRVLRKIPALGKTVAHIKNFVKGNSFLEVGVGDGAMIAAAKEMQFTVEGLEIRASYAENVSKQLNIPIHNVDYIEFSSERKFDVICMGDVIEHISDPVKALEKSFSLLNDTGILWISTPNFQSAFSMFMKDKDAMWRICEHLNYFSFDSFEKILNQIGFEVIDYQISFQYNGSMEVIAKKVI